MKAYQPTVLNTLDPYSGPQGYGMNRYTGQTIDQQTTVGVNQIDPVPFRGYSTPTPTLAFYGLGDNRNEMQRKGPTGRVMIPSTQPAPAAPVTVNIEPSAPQVKPWYKSPLYIALLAAGALLAARKFKLV